MGRLAVVYVKAGWKGKTVNISQVLNPYLV